MSNDDFANLCSECRCSRCNTEVDTTAILRFVAALQEQLDTMKAELHSLRLRAATSPPSQVHVLPLPYTQDDPSGGAGPPEVVFAPSLCADFEPDHDAGCCRSTLECNEDGDAGSDGSSDAEAAPIETVVRRSSVFTVVPPLVGGSVVATVAATTERRRSTVVREGSDFVASVGNSAVALSPKSASRRGRSPSVAFADSGAAAACRSPRGGGTAASRLGASPSPCTGEEVGQGGVLSSLTSAPPCALRTVNEGDAPYAFTVVTSCDVADKGCQTPVCLRASASTQTVGTVPNVLMVPAPPPSSPGLFTAGHSLFTCAKPTVERGSLSAPVSKVTTYEVRRGNKLSSSTSSATVLPSTIPFQPQSR